MSTFGSIRHSKDEAVACTLRCRGAEVVMSPSRRTLASYLPLVLAAALSSFGCDDDDTTTGRVRGVGPSPLRPQGFVNVQGAVLVQPTFIQPVATTTALCPASFFAPFTVVFDGDGRSDLAFAGVEAEFVDHFGVLSGSMTLGPNDLARRFGSTALPVFGSRAFPFSFPFGCVGRPIGTLSVAVVTTDSRDRQNSTTLRIPVR